MIRSFRSIDVNSSIKLCRGSKSVFPATCVKKAPRNLDRVALCTGANIDAPAECARKLWKNRRHGLDRKQIVAVCTSAQTLGPVKCIVSLPHGLDGELKVRLCRNAASSLPADCFSHAMHSRAVRTVTKRNRGGDVESITKLCEQTLSLSPVMCINTIAHAKDLSLPQKTRLCLDAQDTSPASCYLLLHKIINIEHLIRFCSHRKSPGVAAKTDYFPIEAANCVLQLTEKTLSASLKLSICRNAKSAAPAICFANAISSKLPVHLRADLCRETDSALGPIECFSVTTGDINGEKKVKLCSRAISEAPARCAQRIQSRNMRADEKVKLCEKAIDTWPAKCANSMPRKGLLRNFEVARLCNEAISLDPGECFLSAPNTFSTEQKISLCRRVKNAEHVVKCARILTTLRDIEQRVLVCSQVTSALVVECIQHVSLKWHIEIKLSFCSNIRSRKEFLCVKNLPTRLRPTLEGMLCQNATNNGPIDCLHAMPSRFTDDQSVSMCRGSRSDMPAKCAREASLRLPTRIIEIVCKQTKSIAPGQCLRAQSAISLTAAIVNKCKIAISIPSQVVIVDGFQQNISSQGSMHGKTKLSERIVAVVKNQFGAQVVQQNNLPTLYATVDKGRELGATLIGLKGVNPDERGTYVFEPVELKATRGGVFWINIGGASLKPGRVPFRVRESFIPNHCTDQYTGCNIVYHQLMSTSLKRAGAFHNMLFGAVLLSKWTFLAIACIDTLASESTHLWPEHQTGLVQLQISRRGVGRLKARFDVPTIFDTSFEKLGLSISNHSNKTIRKAYRIKAFEWHPDKWSSVILNAACIQFVAETFDVVVGAYNNLRLGVQKN